jgi:hypothetical protein
VWYLGKKWTTHAFYLSLRTIADENNMLRTQTRHEGYFALLAAMDERLVYFLFFIILQVAGR